MATPDKAIFGRDMLYKLVSVVYWWISNTAKQRQVYIGNVREKIKQVKHD